MDDVRTALCTALGLLVGLDRDLVAIVRLSLQVSLAAVGLATVLGLPLGAAVAVWRFPGQAVVRVGLNALLGLPPVVVGLTTDRGTWLSFTNRGNLTILLAGDARLFNQYGVILVHPARHTHVKAQDGQTFIDWLRPAKGQQAIAAFRLEGEQAFFPNAR